MSPKLKWKYSFEESFEDVDLFNSDLQDSNEYKIKLLEETRHHVQNRIEATMRRTIDLIRESNEMGINTLEEIAREQEQLAQIDKRLEEIKPTAATHRAPIKMIKSVFSGLKNFIWGKSDHLEKYDLEESHNCSLQETLKDYDCFEDYYELSQSEVKDLPLNQIMNKNFCKSTLDAQFEEIRFN
ncbi:synaptosomal-associated protein 29-like [Onthophagus taurus]|uniref:synaptosomal-associated protein 29-like n=1 Tax=Onthophagus taurus TaxID=166361 RepID=UPI000C20761A|nr:synaptosomal-associated protein 29-like [Onthophagus taurus]